MDLVQFNDDSLRIIEAALLIAKERSQTRATSTDLLLACQRRDKSVKTILRELKILPQRIIGRHTKLATPGEGPIPLTDELTDVLDLARILAGDSEATPLHLFCAILAADPECRAYSDMCRLGLQKSRAELLEIVEKSYPSLHLP